MFSSFIAYSFKTDIFIIRIIDFLTLLALFMIITTFIAQQKTNKGIAHINHNAKSVKNTIEETIKQQMK